MSRPTAKRCCKCGTEKPIVEFGPNARMQLGVNSYCRACVRSAAKLERENLPEKVKARKARYYARHRDRLASKKKAVWQEKSWSVRLLWSAKGSSRRRGHAEPSIDAAWIEARYTSQEGRCALTGVEMVLPTPGSMFQVSLDRIDCSAGYTPENVQLVCWGANAARGSRPVQEALTFFRSVANSLNSA